MRNGKVSQYGVDLNVAFALEEEKHDDDTDEEDDDSES